MSAPDSKDPIYSVLQFILEEASDEDLFTLEEAIRKRRQKGPLQRLNFRNMAEQTTAQLETQMPDVHAMTRRLVGNIIMEKQPGIPPAHLDALLDHFAPDAQALQARARAREKQLPPEILSSMMRQFVAYSLGRLPSAEEGELRAAIPDWPERYWELFSEQTRQAIREILKEAGAGP